MARSEVKKCDLFFLALAEIDSQLVERRQTGCAYREPLLDGNLGVIPRTESVQELPGIDQTALVIGT